MKTKIGVFFGGNSVEHEVSIITALQAIENMDKSKYEVIPIYIAKDNKMYCGKLVGDIHQYKEIQNLIKKSKQVTLAKINEKVALIKNKRGIYNYIDIAFPIVHGTNVEDGTLQGYFKMFNLPYVGSDVISSACGMNKFVCKCILKENSIPVLNCQVFNINEYEENIERVIEQVEEKQKYPVIVKPVNLGSSVGINIAEDREELIDSMTEAFQYSNKILIEKAIKNLKEINCSVLGNYQSAIASECEEPIKTDQILSYSDKYKSGGKFEECEKTMNQGVLKLPAEISNRIKARIQELSIKTFNALGCEGVIRIDFLIDKDTEEIFVNEVNTIPGSLSFHLWRESGMNYTELLDKLIDFSLRRMNQEKNMIFSYDTNILSSELINGLKRLK